MREKSGSPERQSSDQPTRNENSPAAARPQLPDGFSAADLHLQLSRARVLDHLGRTKNPAHRAMLERALDDIEAKLRRLK